MKILYLNNEMTVGGVTKCILKLCKELQSVNEIIVASNGGLLVDEFKKMNIKHYQINDVENKGPFNIIRNLQLIKQIIEKEDIDIIHSHHRMTTLISKIISKITGVKIIHTQHLCIEDKFKLTNIALRGIDVISVSESAKNILIEKSRLNPQKIITIYNTIETNNKDKNVDELIINLKNENHFIVGHVSRLVDYKGVYDFLKVAKMIAVENKKIKFVMIGDGPEYLGLRDTIINEDLENTVYLLGRKDNVIEYFKYIDLLTLCSYIEGLPLAPLEAFSQSIPVVATNIEGTNEEITNDHNGFLIEPKDIKSFKEKILMIYNNTDLYNNLKQNSYKTYTKEFNTENYISKHMNLYTNVKGR